MTGEKSQVQCYEEIKFCRICKSSEFEDILHLGFQSLTGVFPKKEEVVQDGPLQFVKCRSCGLFQLRHNFDPSLMYGNSYGYRSSQNKWMIDHLKRAVMEMSEGLENNELIVEVGSNDGTSLAFFPKQCKKIGIDPSADALRMRYPENSEVIADFFSATVVDDILQRHGKASVIMSFAMLYDLPDPIQFAQNIARLLGDNGRWVFEQSYVVSMFKAGAFDTICHEHLEYYCLKDIDRILDESGMKAVEVTLSEANGGSFRVTAVHKNNTRHLESTSLNRLREEEFKALNSGSLLAGFLQKTEECKLNILKLVKDCRNRQLSVYGIGASTKGNVLLQYCGLTTDDLKAIGEINPDKIGKVCPGTGVPIVSEEEALSDRKGVYLILPWHFKSFFVSSHKFKHKPLVFPLPVWSIHNLNLK